MKKLFILLTAVALTGLSYSQSSRLVLVEEFTGETCGPCAASNPGFNTILDAHASNVISLKYQNNIPSAGPNFWPYAQTDISNRTTFYANNYSPHAFIDGNYWNGNAASVTSAQLNTRAAVVSPFDIEVNHTFSPAHDIIYVHTVIRATQTVASGTYYARIAVAERNVYGYTSPNGEDEYSHVMRKMLPNGTGTLLPATWAVGDSAVINEQWTVAASATSYPDPIWAMLEAIVWVQNNSTKQIMQTGHSPALIAVEKEIQLGDIKKRFDIVVYDSNTKPFMLIECKEMNVDLTPQVLNQVLRYNITLQVPYVVITNGTHCMAFNCVNNALAELTALP